MSLSLLRVWGVTLLEKTIGERRPAYRAYVRRTNAFVPGRPKEGGAQEVPQRREPTHARVTDG